MSDRMRRVNAILLPLIAASAGSLGVAAAPLMLAAAIAVSSSESSIDPSVAGPAGSIDGPS